MVVFVLQSREFYAHRHRQQLDAGMRLAAWALGGLASALPLAVVVVAGRASPRVQVAYVALVLMSVSAFVVAHYFKIVPFLVWNHRFGPLAGTRPLPRVSDLYSARGAQLVVALLVTGAVVFVAAVALGWGGGARLGASAFAAGALLTAGLMLAISRRTP